MLQTDIPLQTTVQPIEKECFVARAPREQHQCMLEIFGPTINAFASRIRTISTSGMLIDHGGRLSVGDFVVAKMPGLGDVMGEIVRLRDSGAGMKFTAPISLSTFRDALAVAVSEIQAA